MNLDGPIICSNDRALRTFTNGKVYRATDGTSRCYADNVADLEPYREQGWTIEPLEGDELKTFIQERRGSIDLPTYCDGDNWADLTATERAVIRYWLALMPGTKEHAACNACTDEERRTAVKVLREMEKQTQAPVRGDIKNILDVLAYSVGEFV